jgi:hypothetical protein
MSKLFYLIVAALGLAITVPTADEFESLETRVATLEERVKKLEAPPAPPVQVSRLLQASDLTYLGAFRLPGGTFGESRFEYGGNALCFNPANNSLFIGGHDWQPSSLAEINIPALGTGAYSTLPVATVRQNFIETKLRVPRLTLDGNIKLGGTMLVGGDLLGTLYEYYDGDGTARDSHFLVSGANLATGTYTGLFQVGTMGGGWVGGWMCEVPESWRDGLGTRYLTGNGALSIISRTSRGPAAFGFDPAQLGATPASVMPLLYYDGAHPLAPFDQTGELYNASTQLTGIAFPEGSDSVLFFGRQGTGALKYGAGTTDPSLDGQPVPNEPGNFYVYDLADTSKGYHAWPYRYQVWAYDANDLAAVKSGTKQPWEVRPYKTWELTLPYASNFRLGGVAWDAAGRRLYIAQKHVSGGMPVVHGFGVK